MDVYERNKYLLKQFAIKGACAHRAVAALEAYDDRNYCDPEDAIVTLLADLMDFCETTAEDFDGLLADAKRVQYQRSWLPEYDN